MTLLLEPTIIHTATLPDTPKSSVRIVWVVSHLQLSTPPDGMKFDADGTPLYRKKFMENYMQSKVGDTWLAILFAERLGKHGVMSVVCLTLSIPTSISTS